MLSSVVRGAEPAPRPRIAFPVELVCPACQRPFDGLGPCPCPAGQRLESFHGLPRTLFGQSYWGECSQERMHAILAATEHMHWKEALRQEAADEAVRQHLTRPIGADFLYGMPWDRIRTVLDIGAGMGFLSVPMAPFAETVVALEAVPERAQFIARRAEQDGLANIHPIIASGTALPFPPGSFDLVTMNGVFEYIGLWGQGDPQQLQQEMLERIVRLLRPDGYCYIGIETRYALNAFLGARDHSGLRFTSLLPRWLADRYCKWRAVPFYGSARAAGGYRTYTHTPRQYEKMFHRAGFQTVEVSGLYGGYNEQFASYPMDDHLTRKKVLDTIDPPASLAGRLRRLITNSRWFYSTFEGEVAVFGCKKANAGRLSFAGLDVSGSLARINTSRNVIVLVHERGEPRLVAKACKYPDDVPFLERQTTFLERAERALGQESLTVRWPRPLGRQDWHRLRFFLFEFIGGGTLRRFLYPYRYRGDVLAGHIHRLIEGYVDLTGRLTEALHGGEAQVEQRQALLESLSEVRVDDRAAQARIDLGCATFRRRDWPLRVVHGDLALTNVLMRGEQFVLVDWENFSEAGLAGLDLVRLLVDCWFESGDLGAADRRRFLDSVRVAVRGGLARLGIEPADFPAVVGLYLAHQVRFVRERQGDVERVVAAVEGGAAQLE